MNQFAVYDLNKPSCVNCELLHEDDEAPPDCRECYPLELMPENEPALEVFRVCRWQLIHRQDGTAKDVKTPAIIAAIDGLGHPKQPTFDRVNKLFRFLIYKGKI